MLEPGTDKEPRQGSADGPVGDISEGREVGLTICILNHNRRAYLPRLLRNALDAVGHLNEEGFASEVLVLDLASRDGSQKLLRSVQALYDEPRLELVCLDEDPGTTRSRNRALELARFRYLCTLGAEDELVSENLPTFLRSMQDTGAALAYGNLIEILGEEVVKMRANTPFAPGYAKSSLADSFSIADTDRLLRLGGYAQPHPDVSEDWEMLLHLDAEEQLVLFVPAVLGYVHQRLAGAEQAPIQGQRLSENAAEALRQVYAPEGPQTWEDIRIGRIYHPVAGFVDEW